ncbi:MAG: hypothetical protein QW323_02690, partial [Candidatus Bathyarchaeia archaeon]
MNKKERFLTAIRGEIPDMVPVAPLIHDRFAYKLLGRTGWRAVFEAHQMVGSTWFRGPLGVHFDVNWPHGWGEKIRLIEERGTRRVYEHIIETPHGKLTSKVISGLVPSDPILQRTTEYYIKTEEDYAVYNIYLEEFLRRAKANIEEVVKAYNVMGDEGVPSVGSACAFSHLCQIRGPENLLLDLYKRPRI